MIIIVTAALLTLFGLGVVVSIGQIGKPRDPITPGVAIGTVVFIALQAIGVLYLASH